MSHHQGSLEFGVKSKESEESEEYLLMAQSTEEGKQDKEQEMEERFRALKEAHERMREHNPRLIRADDEIEELENVPAYVRKQIPIDHKQHSEDQEVSRYRLTDDGDPEEGPRLRPDNGYLHDNVD